MFPCRPRKFQWIWTRAWEAAARFGAWFFSIALSTHQFCSIGRFQTGAPLGYFRTCVQHCRCCSTPPRLIHPQPSCSAIYACHCAAETSSNLTYFKRDRYGLSRSPLFPDRYMQTYERDFHTATQPRATTSKPNNLLCPSVFRKFWTRGPEAPFTRYIYPRRRSARCTAGDITNCEML